MKHVYGIVLHSLLIIAVISTLVESKPLVETRTPGINTVSF